jgi:hypothetical protein
MKTGEGRDGWLAGWLADWLTGGNGLSMQRPQIVEMQSQLNVDDG